MKSIQVLIVDFFGFTKTEANAAITLSVMIFLLVVFSKIYLSYSGSRITSQEIELATSWIDSIYLSKRIVINKSSAAPKSLLDFNPNTVNLSTLISIGLPLKISKRIINYREKVGPFKNPEELKKIYGINHDQVDKLIPWIKIDNRAENPEPSYQITNGNEKVDVPKPTMITEARKKGDLDSASITELQLINGIGTVFSKRIVKYRTLLGGFVHFKQLHEIYGLEAEVILKIKDHFVISSVIPPSINITVDSKKKLASHPYLSWNHAGAIVNYRKVHGGFDSLQQLKEIKIISDSLYHKIYPYLSGLSMNQDVQPNTKILPSQADQPKWKQ